MDMNTFYRITFRQMRILYSRRGLAAILSFVITNGFAVGQDTFVAIPPQEVSRYHIDFTRNFFASPETEKADRTNLYATLIELENLKGKVASSATNLYRAMQTNDRVQILFYRHYSYLYLRNAVNTSDEKSLEESSKLDAEIGTRTAFLRQELMRIDDRTLAAFVARKPSLKTYLPAIEVARRYRPYTLSLKEEELLRATAPNNDWQYDLYAKLRDTTQPGSLAGVAEPSTREETFKKYYANHTSQRDLYAFVLMRLAGSRTRLAQLQRFADAPSEVYFSIAIGPS